MEIIFYLSSGLLLGWSLGANDAANVFGTAVGSRMVRFATAAAVCAVFVILGAVFAGAGATHTLGRLGAVNSLAGSFTVALAAAVATFGMTRLGLPISTSQAVVGAIIGWNVYADMLTDTGALADIVVSWVLCPVLAAIIAVLLYLALRVMLRRSRLHLLRQDALVRAGLLAVGAFGAFSLGANNVANVVGVFLPDNPFTDIDVLGIEVSAAQQLFLLGGAAIATGVVTYSGEVMRTVGTSIMRLTPEAAFVVVLAHAIVLFVFASESLEGWLASHGLPTLPLVPVSSSQAVIGAIVGLGLLHGRRHLRPRALGSVALGWLATPVTAGVVAFVLLFFVDNVFDQSVVEPVRYTVDTAVIERARAEGLPADDLGDLEGYRTTNALRLQQRLEHEVGLDRHQARDVIELAEVVLIHVDLGRANLELDRDWLALDQLRGLRSLADRRFRHAWQFHDALAEASPLWRLREDTPLNRSWNREVRQKREYLERTFRETTRRDDHDPI
ncbi:inorganic phosphate transporter [bacterium]|nr:inorganic phosphate transporter [bacterium]